MSRGCIMHLWSHICCANMRQMMHDIIKKLQTLDLQGFEATLNRARDRNRTILYFKQIL